MKRASIIAIYLLFACLVRADEVKIGIILPLTGNTADYGQMCYTGVRLFEHDLAQRDTRHTYKIIVEDDQLNPRQTALALNKLCNIDKVSFLASTTGTSGNVIVPIANQKQIPHFGITADPNVAKGAYNFVHWTQPSAEVPLIIEAFQALGVKRIALLYQRQQGIQAMIDTLKQALPNTDMEIVADEPFTPGVRDFRTSLYKIQQAKPDALIPLAFPPEGDIILKQIKQQGIDAHLSTFEMFDLLEDENAEGLWFVSGAAERKDYLKRMEAFMPGARATYSGYFYDALELAVSAYERQENIDTVEAAQWIAQQREFPSTVGNGTLSIDENGVVHTTAAYYTIKDGVMTQTTLDEILRKIETHKND